MFTYGNWSSHLEVLPEYKQFVYIIHLTKDNVSYSYIGYKKINKGWENYFQQSPTVKSMKEYIVKMSILKFFETEEAGGAYETYLLRKYNVLKNPQWLNKNIGGLLFDKETYIQIQESLKSSESAKHQRSEMANNHNVQLKKQNQLKNNPAVRNHLQQFWNCEILKIKRADGIRRQDLIKTQYTRNEYIGSEKHIQQIKNLSTDENKKKQLDTRTSLYYMNDDWRKQQSEKIKNSEAAKLALKLACQPESIAKRINTFKNNAVAVEKARQRAHKMREKCYKPIMVEYFIFEQISKASEVMRIPRSTIGNRIKSNRPGYKYI